MACFAGDDDVYYYIRWRLKLEGETESMESWRLKLAGETESMASGRRSAV